VKNILAISGIGLIIIILVVSPFLIKVRVDCKSQYGDCPPELITKLNTVTGKRLFFAKNELKKILKSNFLISDFSLQFKLPDMIHADVILKKPMFALKNTSSNQIVLVDKDGMVLEITDNSALPSVETSSPLPKVGQTVDSDTFFALKLENGIFQMYQVNSGEMQNGTLLVELPGQIRVILPLEDADSDLLLGSLRLIYSTIQSGGNKNLYKEIDMRYKNPVLR
jgi:hypothetical protein